MAKYLDLGKATEYIAKLYKRDDIPGADEYLSKVVYEGSTPIVEDDIVRIFKVLLTPIKPKHILEIGMNVGFSTTHLALIAKQYGGKVTTIEYNPKVINPAKQAFEREGVQEYIEIVLGDAKDLVPEVKSESFDVVFQDSAKCLYEPLLDDCVRILKPNGLLLVDDTLWPVLCDESDWNTDYRCLDSFNKAVASRDDLVSTILPIGEGFTVAVKK
ncbi:MAG: class I SAM-dependent methyltransferase [Candidatus Thorarchaeota archaeon]